VLRITASESFNQSATRHGLAWWWDDVNTAYDNLVVSSSLGGMNIGSDSSAIVQKQFTSGIHLVSLPFNPNGLKSSPSLIGQGSAKIARWNPQAGVPYYDVMGEYDALPLSTMEMGRGYWVRLSNSLTLTAPPRQTLKDEPFTLSLSSGWNLVGYPYVNPISFNLDAIEVREVSSTVSISMREAVRQGWIDDVFWTHETTNGYVMVHPTLSQALRELEPWRAYWVRTTRPLELTLPAPSRARAFNRAAAPRRSTSAEEWSLRLVVRGQGSEDACILGVSRATAQGEYLAPKPPPVPEPSPTLYFPSVSNQTGQSQPYAVSLRSALSGKAVWEVEVNPQGSAQPLTLTMPNTVEVPRNLKIWLEDAETGQRRYMRTVSSYTVSSGKPRRFRIIVEPAGAERKLLSAMAATGGSGRPILLSFVLGDEARVSMEVISPTGKLMTRSPAPVRRSAGLNTLIWDGKDSRGSVLPRGVYLFRVTATDDEGRTMALVRPVPMR
jgi:hypothetical protein